MAILERDKGFYERRLAQIARQEAQLVKIAQAAEISQRNLKAKKEFFRVYRNRVWRLVKQQPLHSLPGFEKRAFNAFVLHHRVSIRHGYKYGFPAEWIADFSNLQIIPSSERMKLGHSSVKDDLEAMLERKAKLSQTS